MKSIRRAAFFFGLVFAAAHIQAETLQINGDEVYAPIIYLKDGKPAGILPAIFAHLEPLTGDKYELHLYPWNRAYEIALHGQAGVTNLSWNEARSKLFDFSAPIYDDDIQIVTLKAHSFTYTRLEDLKGKVVGGQLGAAYGDAVDKAIADGMFTMERDVGQTSRLLKLLAGRQDAAFIGNGKAGFELAIASHKILQEQRDRFMVLPTPLTHDPLHLAFAKGMNKREALLRFNAALEKIKKSGEFNRIVAEATKQAR